MSKYDTDYVSYCIDCDYYHNRHIHPHCPNCQSEYNVFNFDSILEQLDYLITINRVVYEERFPKLLTLVDNIKKEME